MFIDRARIMVKGGDGGNGIVSFRREKHIPKGGPNGGDGGAGGDVILVVDSQMTTLSTFERRSHFMAKNGTHGGGKKRHGKHGDDLEVNVPPGTVVLEDGRLVADMVEPGQRLVVARGGRGGRGNARFATPRHRSPRFAEKGEPGEEKWINLELKLLADVGLVGLPNAGKSTLLSVISAAKPDVADYPFTTLKPNLGVVELDFERSFVVADLPGLIKGAHEGVGLGDEFLRHAERTSVLLHLVDPADPSGKSPAEAFREIDHELGAYEVDLSGRPRIVVGTKMDLPEARESWEEFESWLTERGLETAAISAATHEGIDDLVMMTWELLQDHRRREDEDGGVTPQRPAGFKVYRAEETDVPRVELVGEEWVVSDKRFERWILMTDTGNEEALDYLNRRLKRAGLYEILEEAGVREGDLVRIGEVQFEYEPG